MLVHSAWVHGHDIQSRSIQGGVAYVKDDVEQRAYENISVVDPFKDKLLEGMKHALKEVGQVIEPEAEVGVMGHDRVPYKPDLVFGYKG